MGRQAHATLSWKYGCWFFEKTTDSQALIRSEVDPKSGHGTVTLITRHGEIGDMLGFIADELHPHDFDAIVKDDFAAVRAMLSRIADKS